jgi:tRNA (cytidine/uridine-2'-O-)-methyltransferase
VTPPAVILYEPEIPPNTGNVIRLCAITGAPLHLIAPLGFELDDRRLRRAGLDYHEFASLTVHDSLASCLEQFPPSTVYAFTTKGSRSAFEAPLGTAGALLFGPETRGLPDAVLASFPETQRLRLPQLAGRRSLNLSNAVAVAVYEAWRQQGFPPTP